MRPQYTVVRGRACRISPDVRRVALQFRRQAPHEGQCKLCVLLGKVVADWLLATVALYTAKKEKEAAEAAAAAEPAAEEEAQE